MTRITASILTAFIIQTALPAISIPAAPVSRETKACLECHEGLHPGIVADWKLSRHASVSPAEALAIKGLSKKVSSTDIPEELKLNVVGCAECHVFRSEKHKDAFDHNEKKVHTVVSPGDCGVCHREEQEQYSKNLMSFAYRNLSANSVFNDLEKTITGALKRHGSNYVLEPASPLTSEEACYHCHGTELKAVRKEVRKNKEYGDMEFSKIEGWPNHGVGRLNLDGTQGCCTACHARHQFSIETARKPYTCKQCHIGPDVPASKVYEASKHGNIFSTGTVGWDFKNVPWKVGKDFFVPTCASCHVSLVVKPDGELVARRSHAMNDRIPWRIFGLIYAHPHPKEADTTIIRSKDGLPLPTSLAGEPATKYLIGKEEMEKRKSAMHALCLACHASSTVEGAWRRFENTVHETNAKTLIATGLLTRIWSEGLAKGPGSGESPFDEHPERIWADSWLIYANTVRFASAMGFGGDYGVFADGRYQLNKTITRLKDFLDSRRSKPSGTKKQGPG